MAKISIDWQKCMQNEFFGREMSKEIQIHRQDEETTENSNFTQNDFSKIIDRNGKVESKRMNKIWTLFNWIGTKRSATNSIRKNIDRLKCTWHLFCLSFSIADRVAFVLLILNSVKFFSSYFLLFTNVNFMKSIFILFSNGTKCLHDCSSSMTFNSRSFGSSRLLSIFIFFLRFCLSRCRLGSLELMNFEAWTIEMN